MNSGADHFPQGPCPSAQRRYGKNCPGIGVDYLINTRKTWDQSKLEPNLSLALGAANLSLLELTHAFGIFAAQGYYTEPILITRILDKDGNIVEENEPSAVEVISPRPPTRSPVSWRASSRKARAKRPKRWAGPRPQNGTTNDIRDAGSSVSSPSSWSPGPG